MEEEEEEEEEEEVLKELSIDKWWLIVHKFVYRLPFFFLTLIGVEQIFTAATYRWWKKSSHFVLDMKSP